MERTGHVLLAGSGADAFADAIGRERCELLSPEAAARSAARRASAGDAEGAWSAERPIDRGHGALFAKPRTESTGPREVPGECRDGHFDTIGVLTLDGRGVLAGACSTSGMPWKAPGRVGDSPIIGHGLYVDPDVAAVTATGHGELVMRLCGSFLAVEKMREGMPALESLLEVLRRVTAQCAVGPRDQIAMIALRPDGTMASAALRSGFKVVRSIGEEAVITDPDAVLLTG